MRRPEIARLITLLDLLGAFEYVVGLIWGYPLVTVVAVCAL
jgi:hypothetical protein